MPVSAERFGSDGRFATYDPFAGTGRAAALFLLQCRSCGYEPADAASPPPPACPKCHGSAWERAARPGSILDLADGE